MKRNYYDIKIYIYVLIIYENIYYKNNCNNLKY